MAVFPFVRTGFRMEVDYNEGWNVYNAMLVANHQLLYPVRYGWTSVNYPMLWFVILAHLHRFTNDYLFTARALSLVGLLGSCALVGATVRQLGASLRASCLAGFFCLALFVTEANQYVGMADPQLLAQMVFLAGLLVYLKNRDSALGLAAAALLFVLGGSIKHNPIDLPLTVLIDLLFIAPRRALWFTGCGALFAIVSVWLNIHYGGPFFLAQLLAPREYSIGRAVTQGASVLSPLLLPLGIAIFVAVTVSRDVRRRVAGILLVTSLSLGLYFKGGSGVSVNAFFSAFIAISILIGFFFEDTQRTKIIHSGGWGCDLVPVGIFMWLFIPWLLVPELDTGDWNPIERLAEARSNQDQFTQEVRVLKGINGPVLCESLLLCAFSEKPYIYDPFNTNRLIHVHKLDPEPIVSGIQSQHYAAIQLDDSLQNQNGSERFDPAFIRAISGAYHLRASTKIGWIYVPN